MNLEEYRTLFIVVTLGLALVASYPAIIVIVPSQSGSEHFSEIWLLGSGHMFEDYPFNVTAGEAYSVFVGVGNHMGCSEYYVVYVKFRNMTQPLPDVKGSMPSSLPPLREFRFFVADGEAWESPVTFAIQEVSFQDDSVFVGDVSINGVAFPVDASAVSDSEDTGFNFQLFFELWCYDETSQSFQFHDRFVGLLLNVAVS